MLTTTEKQALTRAQRKMRDGKQLTELEVQVLASQGTIVSNNTFEDNGQSPEPNEQDYVQAAESVPRITVVDRKKKHEQLLQHPFGSPEFEIPLRGYKQGWQTRTACADPEHPNRHYDIVHRLNYVPLTPADLAVKPETIGFTVSPDGFIVRGVSGQELLVGKPKDEYDEHQRAKAERNLAALSPGRVRDEVSQAAAKEHGSEAGDQVHDHFTQKDIVEPI